MFIMYYLSSYTIYVQLVLFDRLDCFTDRVYRTVEILNRYGGTLALYVTVKTVLWFYYFYSLTGPA